MIEAGQANRANAAFLYASDHFALTSALFVVAGMLGATLFMSGYLSAFRWNLIWFVEYPDLIKVGLIAIAFYLSASFIAYQTTVQLFTLSVVEKGFRRNILIFLVLLVAFLQPISGFVLDYFGQHNDFHFHVVEFLAIFSAIGLLARLSRFFNARVSYDLSDFVLDILLMSFLLYLTGSTFGQWVKSDKDFSNTIVLDSRAIDKIKLVMVTSHYTIGIAEDETIVILPSDHVKEIRGTKGLAR